VNGRQFVKDGRCVKSFENRCGSRYLVIKCRRALEGMKGCENGLISPVA